MRRAAPWALYAVCAGLMAWVRMPWVDEAWVAGPAVTLLREGTMLDVGGPLPTEVTRQAPLLEMYGLILAGWFAAFGVEIVRARLLTVITGALFLVVADAALRVGGTTGRVRSDVRWLFATSYFFLVTASWVRPDIAALTLALAGGVSVAKWAAGADRRWLMVGHAAVIFATTLHLQAGFVGLATWLATLGLVRRPSSRDVVAFLVPYGVALAVAAVAYGQRLDAVAFSFARGFSGDIVAHEGGIPGALVRYVTSGRWGAAAGMACLVGVVAYGPWTFHRDRRTPESLAVALTAWGAAASWFLTTAVGNNYHAVWITPALVLGAASAWRVSGAFVPARTLRLAVPAVLAVLGVAWTVSEVRENGRAAYTRELTRLDTEHRLRSATISGPREILWHYDFDREIVRNVADGHRPEWFLRLNGDDAPPESVHVGGAAFRRVDAGEVFSLYQRD